MRHLSYTFIEYMYLSYRIDNKELKAYNKGGWLSDRDKTDLIRKRQIKAQR